MATNDICFRFSFSGVICHLDCSRLRIFIQDILYIQASTNHHYGDSIPAFQHPTMPHIHMFQTYHAAVDRVDTVEGVLTLMGAI